MWKNWLSGVLGIAVFIVAFTSLSGSSLEWTLIVLGVGITLLGFWSATEQG